MFGWLPESRRGVWENGRGRSGEDAGVREGAVRGGALRLQSPEGVGALGRRGNAGDLLARTQQVKATPGRQLPVGVWVRGPGREIYIFVRFSKGLLGQSSTWNLRTCRGEAPGGNRGTPKGNDCRGLG